MPTNRLRSIKNRIRAEQRRQDRHATRVSEEVFLPARQRMTARNLRSAYEKLGKVCGETDPAGFALGLLNRDRLTLISEDTIRAGAPRRPYRNDVGPPEGPGHRGHPDTLPGPPRGRRRPLRELGGHPDLRAWWAAAIPVTLHAAASPSTGANCS